MARDEDPPTLIATGTKVRWRLPGLVVALALVGLVGLTRFGATDRPAPTTIPTAVAVSATPTAQATGPAVEVGTLPGEMPRSPDGLTYVDGIPTAVSGEPVYRVRDALLVPVGRTLLVGGWYLRHDCDTRRRNRCAAPTMSDVPLRSSIRTGDLTTSFVVLSVPLSISGAHIVRATVTVDPRCSIRGLDACQPELRVLQQLWSAAG